jgi:PAT family beta-lactamase induction signal transducer AmpG
LQANAESKGVYWKGVPVRNVTKLILLGFSSGLPILLIFSTLSLWLREAGVEKSAVTYFSWAALGYSFKFVWAPIVDKLPLPILSKRLGRRRGWLLFSQFAVIASILWMASVDPQLGLQAMAFGAVALGFSSATQDVMIDAFRIETGDKDQQALLSSSYIAGYRIGMVVAGAGALYLAEILGSDLGSYSYSAWQVTYWAMAAVMGVGVATTILIDEPAVSAEKSYSYDVGQYVRFFFLFLLSVATLTSVFWYFPEVDLGVNGYGFEGYAAKVASFGLGSFKMLCALGLAVLVGILGANFGLASKEMVVDSYIAPISNFFQRYGKLAIWILLLVGFYRVADIVMGVIANVFYQDLGYSKSQIASITKVFGLLMTIVGSFMGGFLALRIGVMRVLLIGAILAAATKLLFVWLANAEPTMSALTMVIAADNLGAGLAVAAFVAWLSSLTSVSFTATQYAIFSSVMTLFPKLLGGYSGTMVEDYGYDQFFLFTAFLGVPVIALICFLNKKL